MKVNIEETNIPGVIRVKPEVYKDHRGFFTEVFRKDQFEEKNLPVHFVQLNHSGSTKNTIRGLHFQWEPPMGKLMRVCQGEAFLVAVDLRNGSPTIGQWYGRTFKSEDYELLWAPACFARGFAVLSDWAEIEYLTTGIYNPNAESGIRWNDPKIGIEWPVIDPILSEKDKNAQTLEQWMSGNGQNVFPYKDWKKRIE